MFSDDSDNAVGQPVIHDTGNPNLRWEVSVTIPEGATKIYINHYSSITEDVSVDGYTSKTIKVALKSDLPENMPNVVQTDGDSVKDVMSQKAVTDMLYIGFNGEYNNGLVTINASETGVVFNDTTDWKYVELDVHDITNPLDIVTSADRVRPIIFTDNDNVVVDKVVHDTGNPNLKWEVSVEIPERATKMFVNLYTLSTTTQEITINGYKSEKYARSSKVPRIVHEIGSSETDVMSQKAVTNLIAYDGIKPIYTINNGIPVIEEDVVCYLENLFMGVSPKEAKIVWTQSVNAIRVYDKSIALIVSRTNSSGQIRLGMKDDTLYETSGTLVIKKGNTKTGNRKVMFIGDSMTENLCYINPLKEISDNGNYKIEFVGTLGADGKKNEGRGGWEAYNYCNNANAYQKNNSFWDGSKFNFPWYMSTKGISVPDYIFINLGTNDALRGISDVTDDEEVKRIVIESYQTMINSIRQYSALIPIVLWLPPTRSLAGRNNHKAIDASLKINKYLIDTFDKTSYINNRVYLMHTYLFVNPYTDYTMQKITIDGVEYDDCAEPIHPSTIGGEKIAKGIIRQMMYIDSVLGF